MRLLVCVAAAALAWTAPAAANGTWESKPAAPLPRQEAAFAELGGKLHLVAGFEQGGADSARHEVFDPVAGTWTAAPPIPEPAHHAQSAVLDGRLYVVGGMQTLGFAPTGRMWEYDPATSLWTLRAGLPRGAGAVVAHGGRLIYSGGLDANGNATNAVDAYDPAAGTWTPLAPMGVPRDHHGAAVVGGRMYAVGGRQAAFGTEVMVTEAFDFAGGTWRSGLAPFPKPRAGFAAVAFGDELVVIGGESADGVHEQVHAYHPGTDLWRALTPMPVPRHGIQGTVFGGGIWVAGGGIDLLVGATAALDVLVPGPRPVPAVLAPVAPPPASVTSSPVASAPRLVVRVVSARGRRVIVRVSSACSLELRDRRGRLIVRGRAKRGGRVGLRVRRPLRAGRYVVVARAGSQVVRRAARVR